MSDTYINALTFRGAEETAIVRVRWQGRNLCLRAGDASVLAVFRGSVTRTRIAEHAAEDIMGHPPRVFIPGVSEHVMRRGVNRCAIVHDDDDRETFLNTVRIASAAHGVDVHSYVLMDTHYHLFVTPPAEGVLSEMMKQLGEEYVRYFNREYDRIGTLWTGRFRDIHKCDERQWYTCLRYIEMNPVEAAMVTAPEEYPWSSYRFHAYGEFSDWLVPHPLYLALGRTPAERQAAYRAFCFATDPATAGV